MAIQKWNYYKVIVTRQRVKTCAGIAWLLAVLTTTPARILTALGVDCKYIKILDLILTLPALICLVVIGYFYIVVYLGIRKRRRDVSNQLQGASPTRVEYEHRFSKKVFIQTVALLISFVPSCTVLFLGEALPFLRTRSYFRWSELLTQLNSLVNPFLYFFALKRFRKAVLEMLRIAKPEMDEAVGERRRRHRRRRRRGVRRISADENLEEVLEFEHGQEEDFFAETVPCDAIMLRDMVNPLEPVIERPGAYISSCEGSHGQVIRVDVHQPRPNRRKTKRQFDCVLSTGSRPETTAEPQSSRHRVKTRSQSWDESASVEVISTLGRFQARERRQRSNSMPPPCGTIAPGEDISKKFQTSC